MASAAPGHHDEAADLPATGLESADPMDDTGISPADEDDEELLASAHVERTSSGEHVIVLGDGSEHVLRDGLDGSERRRLQYQDEAPEPVVYSQVALRAIFLSYSSGSDHGREPRMSLAQFEALLGDCPNLLTEQLTLERACRPFLDVASGGDGHDDAAPTPSVDFPRFFEVLLSLAALRYPLPGGGASADSYRRDYSYPQLLAFHIFRVSRGINVAVLQHQTALASPPLAAATADLAPVTDEVVAAGSVVSPQEGAGREGRSNTGFTEPLHLSSSTATATISGGFISDSHGAGVPEASAAAGGGSSHRLSFTARMTGVSDEASAAPSQDGSLTSRSGRSLSSGSGGGGGVGSSAVPGGGGEAGVARLQLRPPLQGLSAAAPGSLSHRSLQRADESAGAATPHSVVTTSRAASAAGTAEERLAQLDLLSEYYRTRIEEEQGKREEVEAERNAAIERCHQLLAELEAGDTATASVREQELYAQIAELEAATRAAEGQYAAAQAAAADLARQLEEHSQQLVEAHVAQRAAAAATVAAERAAAEQAAVARDAEASLRAAQEQAEASRRAAMLEREEAARREQEFAGRLAEAEAAVAALRAARVDAAAGAGDGDGAGAGTARARTDDVASVGGAARGAVKQVHVASTQTMLVGTVVAAGRSSIDGRGVSDGRGPCRGSAGVCLRSAATAVIIAAIAAIAAMSWPSWWLATSESSAMWHFQRLPGSEGASTGAQLGIAWSQPARCSYLGSWSLCNSTLPRGTTHVVASAAELSGVGPHWWCSSEQPAAAALPPTICNCTAASGMVSVPEHGMGRNCSPATVVAGADESACLAARWEWPTVVMRAHPSSTSSGGEAMAWSVRERRDGAGSEQCGGGDEPNERAVDVHALSQCRGSGHIAM